MGKIWLTGLLAAAFSFSYADDLALNPFPQFVEIPDTNFIQSAAETKSILEKQAPGLKSEVINTVLIAMECAKENSVVHNSILAIIDYSLPANEKRLWVFDLSTGKLLYHSFVSHGFNSGTLNTTAFSNVMNSKSSSLGVFGTQQTYTGRYGEALKLCGIDGNFNSNAYNRAVVMHGAWYVSDDFVKKYGRVGRSWGCPAVPLSLVSQITQALKNNAFMVVYYPDKKWLAESKFLNCAAANNTNFIKPNPISENTLLVESKREAIVFTDLNNTKKLEDKEAIIAVKANDYQRIFNTQAPLDRMLRRQINNEEYIALSDKDLKYMSENKTSEIVYFIIPSVQLIHGYYGTEMKITATEKIKNIQPTTDGFIIYFDKKAATAFKSTEQFIRWLGL